MSNLTLSENMPFEPEINYWKDKLKWIKPLNLFTDLAISDKKSSNKRNSEFVLGKKLKEQLIRFSDEQKTTLFVTLLSAYKVLLYRYCSQDDICVGNIICNDTANSEHRNYLNLLPLRTEINDGNSFEDLLQSVSATVNDAYRHCNVPSDELTGLLSDDIDVNSNPLYRVIFILQNGVVIPSACTLESDITLFVKGEDAELEGRIEYNPDLYREDTIQRIISHYKILLNSILSNPKQTIGLLPILTEAEEHKLLHDFNNTSVDYPSDKTMVDLFEDQVRKTPGNTAIVFENVKLNYKELNLISNQLADYLRKTYEIKPDDLVGLKLERSEWMVIAILGILKSGGAYVPIAPDYPQERINYLINDSGCKLIIDDGELEKFKKIQNRFNQENQSVELKPDNLAYCIYTSGSTGNPKGCLLQHNGLVNRLTWMQKIYSLTDNDVILQKTTFSFDVSVWELLWWAIQGASVCMLQPGGEKSPEAIINAIDQFEVTVMHFVPSMLSVFLEYLENDSSKLSQLKALKQVFTSGEALTRNQAERFNELFPDKSLINLYGPTEASIDVTYFDCKSEAIKGGVPIGRPIDNTQIYILDKFRNLLPVGSTGEIYLAGAGLARGYLNRPELTAEKFVANPFVEGERMYRTGDLGKWRQDGNIIYLGRTDDQVKIRGFRIELDEISSVLQKHNKVKDAVVIAAPVNGQEKELIAYTTGTAETAELKEYLKDQLPAYMVPAYYVQLETIPLTSNGKANRKALPKPELGDVSGTEYVAPKTDTEKSLARIWSNVLGVPEDKIGLKSDFFDLGGHSLLAIQIVNQIKKQTGKILPISVLFKYSNIEALNAFLNEGDTQKVSKSLVPIKPSGNKRPVYFIHGAGLNVMNFAELAMSLDKEQPVFGIQALGLGGKFPPVTTISEIAKIYVSEIMEHDPNGPYALAGYSLGGFIAIEMRKQFEALNKQVSVLAMIDTYADHTDNFFTLLPKKLDRHIRKWMALGISLIRNPNKTIREQRSIYLEDKQYRYDAIKLAKESGDREFYKLMKHIRATYYESQKKSKIEPFDGFLYLFRAVKCLHYTDDKVYLGWRKYALRGMKEFLIPGDHRTMFLKPNVEVFANALQEVLNTANSEAKKKK